MGTKRVGMARVKSLINENVNQLAAQRQVVGAITASTSLKAGNSGATYMINSNALAIVITLPALVAGQNFRFVIGNELTTLDSKTITIQSNGGALAGGEMVGSVNALYNNGTDLLAAGSTAKKGDNHYQLVIDSGASGNKLYAGSVVELWCDGSYWYVSGQLKTDASTTKGTFAG